MLLLRDTCLQPHVPSWAVTLLHRLCSFPGKHAADLYVLRQYSAVGLTELLGDNFARGHAQASGGSVSSDAFTRLLKALGFDEHGNTLGGSDKKRKQAAADAEASGAKKTKTLMNFGFKKQSPSKPAEDAEAAAAKSE